jgi:uncharacterized protein (TIGR02646 family)
MRKFQRGAEPDFLADKWETWGLEWEQRRNTSSSAQFSWRTIGGEKLNHKLLPLLKQQTQEHCSFCDAFPVAPPSIETIEHFRPKSSYPRAAYHWPNLYYCCMYCQQKGDEFVEALLQPDANDYEFDNYFRWDFTTGRMEINTLASEPDQHRAEQTIKIYRLNEGHPRFRRLAMQHRSSEQAVLPDELPYRHYV